MKKTPKNIPAKSGVYEIVNTETGMKYIGSSVNLRSRRSRHMSSLRNGNHYNDYLQNSYSAHGEGKFQFNVIEVAPESEIRKIEQEVIDKHDFNLLYNALPNVSDHPTGKRKKKKKRNKLITAHFPVISCPHTKDIIRFSNQTLTTLFYANAGHNPNDSETWRWPIFGEVKSPEDYIIWLSNIAFEATRIQIGEDACLFSVEVVELRLRTKKDGRRGGGSNLRFRPVYSSQPSKIEYYNVAKSPHRNALEALMCAEVLPPNHVADCLNSGLVFTPADDSHKNQMERMFVNLTNNDPK